MQMKITMIATIVAVITAPVFVATVSNAAPKAKAKATATAQTQTARPDNTYNAYTGSDQQRWLDRAAAPTNQ